MCPSTPLNVASFLDLPEVHLAQIKACIALRLLAMKPSAQELCNTGVDGKFLENTGLRKPVFACGGPSTSQLGTLGI